MALVQATLEATLVDARSTMMVSMALVQATLEATLATVMVSMVLVQATLEATLATVMVSMALVQATLEATLVDARSTMMVSMALVQALVDRIWTTQLGGPAPVTILTTLTDGLHRMIAWMILCTGAAGLCGELPNFLC